MEKPIDPVAAANATVTAAHQTLNELIAQRNTVTAREQSLTAERSKIAFAAHGSGNAKAKTRLGAIHRELAEIGSETAGFDAAIDEAKARLAEAKQTAGHEVERRRCQEALDRLETLVQHAHGADAALRQYIEAITGLDKAAQAVCAIAGRPTRDAVILGLRRSLYAALTGYTLKRVFEVPLLPPSERQPLSHWAESWAVSIRTTLAQRLSEPESQNKDEAA